MINMRRMLLLCAAIALMANTAIGADSLPTLKPTQVPQNVKALWSNYDPKTEPLDVKVIHEWNRGGVTVQMLTYHIGTFKGKESRMGAYYAFPSGLKKDNQAKAPGILQMHGGGQRAMSEIVEAAAANGYASISINWGGKPMADQKTGDAGTDWGAVDPTQTGHNTHYNKLTPDEKTLDPFVSPRNNNWFLIVLAARRAITFLEQQPLVDGNRLGVTGHSMGGKLTVMTAGTDKRIKAAVPSCGGTAAAPQFIRDRPGSSVRPANDEPLYYKTIDDLAYIKRITCPILYTGPHNDFNGILDNLYANWQHMPSKRIHYSVSPHLNHRHINESYFAGLYFFDSHLLGKQSFPSQPNIAVKLKTNDGIAQVVVTPDGVNQVKKVDIYYSVSPNSLTRFWRTATSHRKKDGDTWHAKLPVNTTDQPLFVMANVSYPLTTKLVGPRWNRDAPKTFMVSTKGLSFEPQALKDAGVRATDTSQRTIEGNFDTQYENWQDWYVIQSKNPWHRQCFTRKIKDPKWRGPHGGQLAIDVLDTEGGEIVVRFNLNGWRTYGGVESGQYYASKQLAESDQWQTVEINLKDLKPLDSRSPKNLGSWQYMTEFGIVAAVRERIDGKDVVIAGGKWSDDRRIRNARWIGGVYPKTMIKPGKKISKEEYDRFFTQKLISLWGKKTATPKI
jgi:cephalosporin-C deacetylase-like acetyl esterase